MYKLSPSCSSVLRVGRRSVSESCCGLGYSSCSHCSRGHPRLSGARIPNLCTSADLVRLLQYKQRRKLGQECKMQDSHANYLRDTLAVLRSTLHSVCTLINTLLLCYVEDILRSLQLTIYHLMLRQTKCTV